MAVNHPPSYIEAEAGKMLNFNPLFPKEKNKQTVCLRFTEECPR